MRRFSLCIVLLLCGWLSQAYALAPVGWFIQDDTHIVVGFNTASALTGCTAASFHVTKGATSNVSPGSVSISGHRATLDMGGTAVAPLSFVLTTAISIVGDTNACRVSADQSTAFAYPDYAHPLHGNSYWNRPLAAGATDVALGLTWNQGFYDWEDIIVRRMSNSDPQVGVFNRAPTAIPNPWCNQALGTSTSAMIQVKVPAVASFEIAVRRGNSIVSWVNADNITLSGWSNNQFHEQYLTARCASFTGGMAQQFIGSFSSGLNAASLTGNDTLTNSHAGSNLPALPGLIRSGELTTAAGVKITHALNIQMSLGSLNNTGLRHRWPATTQDGQAYGTSAPTASVQGSLYRIPPSTNCSTLLTEPGKKLCWAMQEFGGFSTDSGCNNTCFGMKYSVETADPGAGRTVPNQMVASYGINLGTTNTGAEANFRSDMRTIYGLLHIVDNDANRPKGTQAPTIASAVTPDTAANTIVITFANPGTSPMLPSTNCTGFSATKAAVAWTVSSCTRTSSAVFTLTMATSATNGQALLLRYSQAGNVTNSDSSPVELITYDATNEFTVTNQVGAAPTAPVLTLVHARAYKPNFPEGQGVLSKEDGQAYVGIGRKARARFGIADTVAALVTPVAFVPECQEGAGSFFDLAASFGSNNLRLAVDNKYIHGTLTTNLLTLNGRTFKSGGIYLTSEASDFPLQTMAVGDQLEYTAILELDTDVSEGTLFTCRLRRSDGGSMTQTQPLVLRASNVIALQ